MIIIFLQNIPGRSDTLIYADIGPSSGKRRHPVTFSNQDEHRVVYSTVNHALQVVSQKNTHDKYKDACHAGELFCHVV